MTVAKLMSRDLVMVELDDRLALVKDIFERRNFHHVLAIDEGELVGIVSDRDLFKALSPNLGLANASDKDEATLNKRVHQVMSHRPLVLREDASIDEALNLFNSHPISCIPIVNERKRPIGIVTWHDLLRYFHQKIQAETSAAAAAAAPAPAAAAIA
ncbi:MAG: CBS domain-containing protein [Pseudomonadota bacterium]